MIKDPIKLESLAGGRRPEPRGKRGTSGGSRRLLECPRVAHARSADKAGPGSRMKRPGGGTAGRGRRREPGGAAGGREEHAPSSTYAKTAWRSAGAPGARGAHRRSAPAAARRAAGTVGPAGSGRPPPRPPRAPRPAEPAGPATSEPVQTARGDGADAARGGRLGPRGANPRLSVGLDGGLATEGPGL